MKATIQGVGINDSCTNTANCPYYKRWVSMLKRCYSDSSKKTRSTYSECYVCDDWLTFSNFKSWMEQQDWEGKHLDKDILVYGNKIYSPSTCAFISPMVNTILSTHKASKGKFPTGVNFHKKSGRFQARCNFKGKRVNIGYYDTVLEAEIAYKNEKRKVLIEVAKEQSDEAIKIALEKIAQLI